MLAKGANPYDVAKLLGDTVATVETHYAPFAKELRDRARKIITTTSIFYNYQYPQQFQQIGEYCFSLEANLTLLKKRRIRVQSFCTALPTISTLDGVPGMPHTIVGGRIEMRKLLARRYA
jgi:hypothetical protein